MLNFSSVSDERIACPWSMDARRRRTLQARVHNTSVLNLWMASAF